MIKEIDITKLRPFDWKWLLVLIVAIIIIGTVAGIGMWLKDKVTKAVSPAEQEPVI